MCNYLAKIAFQRVHRSMVLNMGGIHHSRSIQSSHTFSNKLVCMDNGSLSKTYLRHAVTQSEDKCLS